MVSETTREVSGIYYAITEEEMLLDSGPFGSGSPLAVLKYHTRDIIRGRFNVQKMTAAYGERSRLASTCHVVYTVYA